MTRSERFFEDNTRDGSASSEAGASQRRDALFGGAVSHGGAAARADFTRTGVGMLVRILCVIAFVFSMSVTIVPNINAEETGKAAEDVALAVEETAELESHYAGKEGCTFAWNVDPTDTDVVSLSDTDTGKVTVTGMTEGTATVSCTASLEDAEEGAEAYTDTWTVTVESAEATGAAYVDTPTPAEEAAEVTAEASGDEPAKLTREDHDNGYTVTVEGDRSALPDDVQVYADLLDAGDADVQAYYEAYAAALNEEDSSLGLKGNLEEDASSFSFLKMFHIYLSKDGGSTEWQPDGNADLQVTIAFDEGVEGLSEAESNGVLVGHYAKTSEGGIEEKAVSDNSAVDEADPDVKKVSVEDDAVKIHLKSFSVVAVSTVAAGSTTGTTSSPASTTGSIMTGYSYNNANEWQIVSGAQYSGNAPVNKTLSDDGTVRVQKNIIPTGVENEFYVYLSVDTKSETVVNTSVIGTFIETANFYARTSNTFQTGVNEGDWIDEITITHGSEMNVWIDSNETLKKGQVEDLTITYKGQTIGTYRVCASNSNGTMYLPLSTGGYIAMFNFKDHVTSGTVELSDAAYKALVEEVTETTTLGSSVNSLSVNELIDTNRFRIDSVQVDSDSSYNQSTGVWTINDDRTGTKTTTTKSGEGTATVTTTTWTENAAELLYKVTLNTTTTDFNSSAGEYFIGSKPAIANYEYGDAAGSVNFPNVSVKGLQYDVKVLKVDQDGNPMSNVNFSLTGNDGNGILSDGYNLTQTTGSDGYAIFAGMAWGTYTISEVEAPSGYRKAEDQTVTLCYTTEPDNLIDVVADVGTDKLYKDASDNAYLEFINKKNSITFTKDVATEGDMQLGEVDQTLYIALWTGGENGHYVCDDQGNIIYKTITITDGAPSPASVTFEDIDTGFYDVVELASVSDGEPTVLKIGDELVNSEETEFQLLRIDGSNDADLRNTNTAAVTLTNVYSHPSTIDFIANKKWADPDGNELTSVPSGAQITFTLYRQTESGTPEVVVSGANPITLDGTADENGESVAWQATFSDLPKADDEGNVYTYMVKESSCTLSLFDAYASQEATTPMGESDYMTTNGGTIWNKQKTVTVQVRKVDQDDNPLAGVVFELYSDANCTIPVSSQTTASDGTNAIATFSSLKPGATYYLKEISTVAGYQLLTDVITLAVNDDGVPTMTDPNSDDGTAKKLKAVPDQEYTYYFTLTNKALADLPTTAGPGIWNILKTGGLLALLGLAMVAGNGLYRRNRAAASGLPHADTKG